MNSISSEVGDIQGGTAPLFITSIHLIGGMLAFFVHYCRTALPLMLPGHQRVSRDDQTMPLARQVLNSASGSHSDKAACAFSGLTGSGGTGSDGTVRLNLGAGAG